MSENSFTTYSYGTSNPLLSSISIRDHFAGLALEGFVSGCPWSAGDLQDPVVDEMLTEVAALSYKFADAMLKARDK